MTEDGDEDSDATGKRLTIGTRVRVLERDTRAHARSLTEIVNIVGGLSDDIKKLTEWQMTRLLAEAREEERDKALYGRLDRIDESIKAMRGAWTKILWIAAGTIIPAVVIGIAIMISQSAKMGGVG